MNRAARRAGIRGSRAGVSRMADRRKAPPSLATHLGVRRLDGTVVRVWHPDYLRKVEEGARATGQQDPLKG